MSATLAAHRFAHARLDPRVRPQFLPRGPEFAAAPTLEPGRLERARATAHALHDRVARRLAQPVRAWCDDAGRVVELWGLIEISVQPDGTGLEIRPVGAPPGHYDFDATFDLSQPIGAHAWTVAFEPLIREAALEAGLDARLLPARAGDWIGGVLRATFERYVDFDGLRRDVLEFLRVDPLLACLTRRVFRDRPATLDEASWVAQHARELSRIGIEEPQLLPLMAVTRGECAPGGVREAFERAVRAQNMTRIAIPTKNAGTPKSTASLMYSSMRHASSSYWYGTTLPAA